MARTKARKLIRGSIAQWERPEWRPLMEIVGDELARWFMWMGEVELIDGSSVHAYKHRITRRYFHLGTDGRAFAYVPPRRIESDEDAYREIPRTEAIDEAFWDWAVFFEGDETFPEQDAKVREARATAECGELAAFDPTALDRQLRFDAAVAAARNHEVRHDPGFMRVRHTEDGDAYVGDNDRLDDTLAEAS